MKILISLSAVKNFASGTRVAVEFDKDDWSVGTVLKTTPTGWKIDFDYGEDNRLIKSSDGRIQEVEQKRKLKKPLTYAQVKALKPKARAILPAPVSRGRKPVSVKPAAAPKPAEPEHPKDVGTPSELRLANELGKPARWTNLDHKSDTRAKLTYIRDLWIAANQKLFDSRLSVPASIYMAKDAGVRTRGLGVWHQSSRRMGFAPRLFLAPEHRAIETVVHEMCHQAVNELDKVFNNILNGHGPEWQAWMRKCGLEPNRYATGNEDFLTDDEKEDRQKKIATLEGAKQEAEKKGLIPLTKVYLRTLPRAAQYVDPATGIIHKGMAVGPHDRSAKRVMFLSQPTYHAWLNVPTQWIHLIPAGPGRDQYESPEYREAAANLLRYVEQRKILKSARRSYHLG